MNYLHRILTVFACLLTGSLAWAISPQNPTEVPAHIKRQPNAGKPTCRVMDRELQGEFVGNCDDDGYADGYATIRGKASYTGQFRLGRKDGFGIKTWPNGDVYAGAFKSDFKEGEGIYRWGQESPSAGDVYIGQFRNDQRTGLGTYHWANGDVFSGEWLADKYMGPPTPMQQLQIKHDKALADAVRREGVVVCKNLNPPDPPVNVVVGTVKSFEGDYLFVEVIRDNSTDAKKRTRAGVTIKDDYRRWAPCDLSLLP